MAQLIAVEDPNRRIALGGALGCGCSQKTQGTRGLGDGGTFTYGVTLGIGAGVGFGLVLFIAALFRR